MFKNSVNGEKKSIRNRSIIDGIIKFSIFSFLYPYVKKHKIKLILSFFSLSIAALSTLSIGWAIKYIVDTGLSGESSKLLESLGYVFIGIFLLSAASFGRSYFVTYIGESIITKLRMDLFKKIMSLDVGYFETRNSGEFISRMNADTTLVQVLVGTSLGIALRNILLSVGGLIMMFQTSLKLSVTTILVIPVVILPIIFFGKIVKRLSFKTQDSLASMANVGNEMISNIRTCQSFVYENNAITSFNKEAKKSFHYSVKRTLARSILAASVILIVFSSIGFVFYLGGSDVIDGKMTSGDLSAFLFYAIVVAASTGSFSEIINDFQRASGGIKRISDILSEVSLISVPRNPKKIIKEKSGTIALHNVLFSYPNDENRIILNDFTLSLIPGEKVALVGPSGSGKSTVFNLILRFYDPQAGCVYFNGRNIKSLDPKLIRQEIGIVPQDIGLFSTSILENVRIANPDASIDDVKNACSFAYLDEFIDSLPNKLNTVVGENGVMLSGGQRQRVAIARAILKDPSILLLDEATNSLDAGSEEYIQKSLQSLSRGRTTLIIAHRLSTVLSADRIIFIDKGMIVETGTHAELVAKDGAYKKLAVMQFNKTIS